MALNFLDKDACSLKANIHGAIFLHASGASSTFLFPATRQVVARDFQPKRVENLGLRYFALARGIVRSTTRIRFTPEV